MYIIYYVTIAHIGLTAHVDNQRTAWMYGEGKMYMHGYIYTNPALKRTKLFRWFVTLTIAAVSLFHVGCSDGMDNGVSGRGPGLGGGHGMSSGGHGNSLGLGDACSSDMMGQFERATGLGKCSHGREDAIFGLLIAMDANQNQKHFMGSCSYNAAGTNAYCNNYYDTMTTVASCNSSGGSFSSSPCPTTSSGNSNLGFCRVNDTRDEVFYNGSNTSLCNTTTTGSTSCQSYCTGTLNGFYFSSYSG